MYLAYLDLWRWFLTEAREVPTQGLPKSDGIERSISNIKLTDRMHNILIQSKTGMTYVGEKSASLNIGWSGTGGLEWSPKDGYRSPVRPKTRWVDEFDVLLDTG